MCAQFLAEDGMDTDMPSKIELMVLSNVFGKAFFACVLSSPSSLATHPKAPSSTFQIFFYALRPGFVRYQAPTRWIALNFATQILFNVALVKFVGANALWYLLISSFLAGSLHPCAGHFIAEHFLFDGLDQETWSYYGPLNILAYNVRLPVSLVSEGRADGLRRWGTITSTMTSPLSPGPSSQLSAPWRASSTTPSPITPVGLWSPTASSLVRSLLFFRLFERELIRGAESDVGLWSRVKRKGRGGARGGDGGGGAGEAGGLKDE